MVARWHYALETILMMCLKWYMIWQTTTTTTVLRPFFRDHPGEPVPEENFWTLWCKGRLTEVDTTTTYHMVYDLTKYSFMLQSLCKQKSETFFNFFVFNCYYLLVQEFLLVTVNALCDHCVTPVAIKLFLSCLKFSGRYSADKNLVANLPPGAAIGAPTWAALAVVVLTWVNVMWYRWR